jgi:hypothetical protein
MTLGNDASAVTCLAGFICSARESKIIIRECSKLASKCKQAKARKGEIDGSLMALIQAIK